MHPLSEPKLYPKLDYIVYVDDDEEDRVFFSEAFREINNHTKLNVFENGHDLLASLRNKSHHPLPPACIICDMQMPQLDGIDLLKLLKSEPAWKGIPVVIFSTSSSKKDSFSAIDAGALAFFSKPNSMIELKMTISDILNLCAKSMPVKA